jgi:hypothetical protein
MTASKVTTRILATLAAMAMALGLSAAPAGAVGHGDINLDQITFQQGLVNVGVTVGDVTVQDVIDIGDITVTELVNLENVAVIAQVPIGIAANVCPAVNAAVLGKAQQSGEGLACLADAESAADSRVFQRWMNR